MIFNSFSFCPVIAAYVGVTTMNSFVLQIYKNKLSSKPHEYVDSNTAKVAHIPFTQFKVGGAINHYSVVTPTMPFNNREIY